MPFDIFYPRKRGERRGRVDFDEAALPTPGNREDKVLMGWMGETYSKCSAVDVDTQEEYHWSRARGAWEKAKPGKSRIFANGGSHA